MVVVSSTRPNFFCNPVVLELICYRTTANRLINKRNTTTGQRKNWTGSCFDPYNLLCLAARKIIFSFGRVSCGTYTDGRVTGIRTADWIRVDHFFVRCCRIRVDLLTYESKTTDKQQQNEWRAKKNLDGQRSEKIKTEQLGNNFLNWTGTTRDGC